MKENVPGGTFYYTNEDAIFIYSGNQLINISAIWKLLNLKTITASVLLDVFLCFGILFIINYIILIKRNNIKDILERCKTLSKKQKAIFEVITYSYIGFSVFILYWMCIK
jgi:hypothetical protein